MEDRIQLAELAADLRTYLEDQAATAAGAPEVPVPVAPEREVPSAPAPSASQQALEGQRESLAQIRDDLGECTRCKLAPTRTRLVFGDGSPSADLVFVGEAPGHDEDQQGLPFVGAAGEMLTRMITNVLRLRRDQVYIGNLLKCRPPANRDPQPDEITMCTPFLDRQLASIGPRLIVALGRPAAQFLLGTTEPVGRLRGQVHHRGDVPVIVTYHPAYLLRSPHEKRKAMDDLQQIRAVLQQATGVELPPPLSGREAREH